MINYLPSFLNNNNQASNEEPKHTRLDMMDDFESGSGESMSLINKTTE